MKEVPGVILDGDGVRITVQVAPRASSSGIMGAYGEDALRVRLNAPPVDGKANAELVRFIAEVLGVAQRRVSLVSGATSRRKVVKVEAYALDEAQKRLKV